MNLDYYNFKQNPFPTTPDLDHLFLSPSHHAALRAIIDGVENRRGIVVITGREEVGKTTILRTFLHRADPKTLKTIRIQRPTVSYPDLVAVVARALGLDAQTEDVEALLAQLHSALSGEYQAGRNMALVIDEAQHMPLDTLTSLSRLVTLEASQVNSLQIVMAGSSELTKKLNQKALRPLKRHVAVHETMLPLTKTESIAYIRDHLAKATEEPDTIFSRKALKHIVKCARGAPRMLNILCVDALGLGAYWYEQPISAKTVKDMIADWESTSLTSYSSHWLVGTIGAVAVTVVLALLWVSLPKTYSTVITSAANSTLPDHATRVAQSKSVAPSQPSLPITRDERQVTKANPQTSLSRSWMETADGKDRALEVLKYQVSEPQASDRVAEEKEIVLQAVEKWQTAWQSQNVAAYVAQYTDNFRLSNGQSHKAWLKDRQAKLERPKTVSVELMELRLKRLDSERWQVVFLQHYHSDRYEDLVSKELLLTKLGDRYLIEKERVLSQFPLSLDAQIGFQGRGI